MIFVRLLLTVLLVANLLIVIMSCLTGVNIYKKYGNHLFKGFFKFLLLLTVFLIAIAISGLGM
jgi:hypothetical protein